MKLRKRHIIMVLGVLTFLWCWSEVQLLSYLWMQGQGQLKVLWHARPVESLMEEETVSIDLKNKLELVDEIKAFAQEALGFEVKGLYTTLYDQKDKEILWNLSACKPYQLESVEWHFPIVGSVSYKGFFDLERAKKEEQTWIDQGYDTRIRPVNAWSTLGWFADPILSNNLKRPEGAVAELFIHEMTHANIFFKDSLTFDENLASFIGEQGALMFLEYRYGTESQPYLHYVEAEHDTQRFMQHCLKGVKELGILYQGMENQTSEEEKKLKKSQYMQDWVIALDTIPFNHPEHYHGKFKEELPNNAFFMAFERYDSKKDELEERLENQFKGDLRAFIAFFKAQM